METRTIGLRIEAGTIVDYADLDRAVLCPATGNGNGR